MLSYSYNHKVRVVNIAFKGKVLVSTGSRGDQMVSALNSGAVVPISSLVRGMALCCWARHFTLTLPLFRRVNKWVHAKINAGGNPVMDRHPIRAYEE